MRTAQTVRRPSLNPRLIPLPKLKYLCPRLDTWRDGFVVLSAIAILFKDYKPFAFFGTLAAFLAGLSLFVGYFPIEDYVLTGMVDRFPLAILAASLGILSALLFSVGLILDTVARYHRENYLLIQRMFESAGEPRRGSV